MFFADGDRNVRLRILRRGVLLTLCPAIVIGLATWIVMQRANRAAVVGCSRLSSMDMNHLTEGALGACKTYNEDIANSLKGARFMLNSAGQIRFDAAHPIAWQAKNQFTSQLTAVGLPAMQAGQTRFTPVLDFSAKAPIVDDIERVFGTTATIFQRMNDAGDMLRICTNVKTASGVRAIGTFIPHTEPNGKPNAVVDSVLRGQTYIGRAFVVNSWYMAAYEPLTNPSGRVIGMLYTGLPETQLSAKLRRFNARIDAENKAGLFVIRAGGESKGLAVILRDATQQGKILWQDKDPSENANIQEICKRALRAKPGQISEYRYPQIIRPGSPPSMLIARFTYFPEWDWVIGFVQAEDEYLAAAHQIGRLFSVALWISLGVVAISLVVSFRTWVSFSSDLAARLSAAVRSLGDKAKELVSSAEEISRHASSVAEASSQLSGATRAQATCAEQTSASANAVAEDARKNTENADQMKGLSASAEQIVQQAGNTLIEVSTAIQQINETNDRVINVISSIDEITFATNIVALNASIEAARAGEAGETFAVIAGEVRSLAAKCSEAARETKDVINRSRQELERGNETVSKLVSDLRPVGENTEKILGLAGEITGASVRQSSNLQHMREMAGSIKHASRQSAASADANTKIASSLQDQAQNLIGLASGIDDTIGKLSGEFALQTAPAMHL